MAKLYRYLSPNQLDLLDKAEDAKDTLKNKRSLFTSWHEGQKAEAEGEAVTLANLDKSLTVDAEGFTPEEKQMRNAYASELQNHTADGEGFLNKLKSEFYSEFRNYLHNPDNKKAELKREAQQLKSQEEADEVKRHQNEIAAINKGLDDDQDDFTDVLRDFQTAERKYGRNEPDGIDLFIRYPIIEWFLLLGLALLELMANNAVVLYVFQEVGRIESFVIGFAIVTILVLGAHFGGSALKRIKTGQNKIALIFWLTLLIPLAFVLAYLRECYSLSIPIEDMGEGFGDIIKHPVFWFYALLNLAFSGFGFWIGYKAVDTSQEFQKKWKKYDKARRKFKGKEKPIADELKEKERAKNNLNLDKIAEKHRKRLAEIDEKMAEGRDVYQEFLQLFNGLRSHLIDLEELAQSSLYECVDSFRSSYKQNISNEHEPPSAWADINTLKLKENTYADEYPELD